MDKIICFGKNYIDHMYELGDAPVDKPIIFLKPESTLVQCAEWNSKIKVELITDYDTHYECEIVLKLRNGGYKMTREEALGSIGEYTIGLDMTLRDLQYKAKKAGHPWTTSKVFPSAAIIGPWINAGDLSFLEHEFSFSLDGVKKQQSTGSKMIYSPVDLIMQASQYFQLCAGDIIFAGTPAGVGMVKSGSVGEVKIIDDNYRYNVEWI